MVGPLLEKSIDLFIIRRDWPNEQKDYIYIVYRMSWITGLFFVVELFTPLKDERGQTFVGG
jgi:hypothetical protein